MSIPISIYFNIPRTTDCISSELEVSGTQDLLSSDFELLFHYAIQIELLPLLLAHYFHSLHTQHKLS